MYLKGKQNHTGLMSFKEENDQHRHKHTDGVWANRVLGWRLLAHGDPHRLPGAISYSGT